MIEHMFVLVNWGRRLATLPRVQVIPIVVVRLAWPQFRGSRHGWRELLADTLTTPAPDRPLVRP